MNTTDLRRLAMGATPGEWRRAKGTPNYRIYGNFREVASAFQVRHHTKAGDLLVAADGHANADFIAAANPAAVLALLDLVEGLAGALRPFAAVAEDYLGDTVNFDDDTIIAGRITRRGEEGTPPRIVFADLRNASLAIAAYEAANTGDAE